VDSIRIEGGRPLYGAIHVGGAKNAALKLMCAALLTDQPLVLDRVPRLADIRTLEVLLAQHGVEIKVDDATNPQGQRLTLQAGTITNTTAPYDLVRRMRASVLVLGPLVARCGTADVSLPGGCAIGARPVNLHIDGLRALGAEIDIEGGYIRARAPKGLTGAVIRFPFVSVGATENLLMAATLAKGETVLENAAREPEIGDLAHCLIKMGAEIDGIGTDRLRIVGKPSLGGAVHKVMADRIEGGTYALAAAIAGGKVELIDLPSDHLGAMIDALRRAGVTVEPNGTGTVVRREHNRISGVDVITEPYPGFPTDLQAQFMTLMTIAEGAAMVTETIFENRFMHVPELARMGANITVHHASALVRGVPKLKGAPVMATDLRASVSLVLAGLAAEGETIVSRVYHLDRGYERVEEKLSACGARIERIAA
jgi:UDP-N-acetylglucosamine 1-carboxyvinyltransferase